MQGMSNFFIIFFVEHMQSVSEFAISNTPEGHSTTNTPILHFSMLSAISMHQLRNIWGTQLIFTIR